MNPLAEFDRFTNKFRVDEFLLASGRYWRVSLRPHQVTFGSMILSARDAHMSFCDANEESGVELMTWFSRIEQLMKAGFGAERINVLCLMMVDPILHFHIIPRFSKSVLIDDVTWEDPAYPGPPNLAKAISENHAVISVLKSIRAKAELMTLF